MVDGCWSRDYSNRRTREWRVRMIYPKCYINEKWVVRKKLSIIGIYTENGDAVCTRQNINPTESVILLEHICRVHNSFLGEMEMLHD